MNDEQTREEQFGEEEQPAPSKAESIAEGIGGKVRGALSSLFAPTEETTVRAYLRRKPGAKERGVPPATTTLVARPSPRPMTPLPFPTSAYEEKEDDLSDLFEVPQEEDNDIYTDDLLELDEEEGVEDLLTVSREDIVSGTRSKSKPKFTRTNRPYYPELTGLR